MPSEFRFLVICLSAIQKLDSREVTLSGIVNELRATRGVPVDLTVVLGLILRPGMEDARLPLMAWKLGKNGEPVSLEGFAGMPLILPRGMGPVALPCEIQVPLNETGIYGFYLFDQDGTFGPPEALLATYMFSVTVE